MHDELSIDELSARTGEAIGRLREWHALGLIGRQGQASYTRVDVDRARFVQLLLRRGVNPAALAEAARAGTLDRWLRSYLDLRFADGGPVHTIDAAAAQAGMDPLLARRLWSGIGLGDPGDLLSARDVELLRGCAVALEAGFPEAALIQLLRVYADALARVAEAGQRLFHFHVFERLRADGTPDGELDTHDSAYGQRLLPLIEPALAYFHHQGHVRAERDDALTHLAQELGATQPREQLGELLCAVVFVDLASFTPLAEAMGDVKAAEVLEQFGRIVREATTLWAGRVVKQIGDAFMLVFAEPRSAVHCALAIESRLAEQSNFPAARSGVHWGPALYREGDYVGSTVNIAARVAAAAGRHQVLVTAAARHEAAGLEGVGFTPHGHHRLKGFTDAMELFEARPLDVPHYDRLLDPVCRMELVPNEVAYRLAFGGTERAFCSEACLRRFVAAPDAYA